MTKTISLIGMRSFVAVCETGGVRAAADKIGRSPSAVSMTLKQLEDDIGAPLFESERKAALSAVGRIVLDEARAIIAHYDRACLAIVSYAADREGRCDVASVPSVAVTLLPRAIAQLRAEGNRFDIHVRDSDSNAIVEAVENGMVEVGLCVLATKRPQLSFEPLFQEPLDFVCPVDHPLAKSKRPLTWEQLESESFIENGAAAALGIAEIEALAASSKLTASNVSSNLAMVEAGLGVTILPRLCRWKSSHAVRFVPLADPRSSRTVGWIAKEGRNLQPASLRFIECIRLQTRASEGEFGYAAA
ncbi:LysR family transcriptional regulator [Mesorhizobium sp. NZP2077]|uniref:LysR family transcriptional regulator n=1 Tax=Mesorhizobium sp. NZP2077 TaxID=2483404 RepID=UPI001554AB08|nr:LysR family transcriptional regulator [Mesorhizobium sp. NZP2077]QKC85473.1 LysR family transcriptional regulator [Mesorhizobium sp. NZP2077]QKD19111.1 LysR family transcriptional regulator [Mesorhizobium sp. NZP2077]